MERSDLERRFAYHAPTGDKASMHELARDACHRAALAINDLAPDGREKSQAVTHLEDAMMWANAAIARNPELA